MNFANLIQAAELLKFVKEHPNCTIPEIKRHFGVPTSKPPKNEEIRVYKIIDILTNYGLIRKKALSSIRPGGHHYILELTSKGSSTLSSLSSKSIDPNLLEENIKKFSDQVIELISKFILEQRKDIPKLTTSKEVAFGRGLYEIYDNIPIIYKRIFNT